MTAQNPPAGPPRALSERTILAIVAAYAAAFVLFGLMLQSPAALLGGLGDIVTTRDALLTDYFGVGGIGGGCVNAGLLTLAAAFVYWRTDARITGASVAALFLVLGFGLFGKNLVNVWAIVLGVYLYAKFRREPFASHVNTAFFGAALAPVFSEILFSTAIPFTLSVPLAGDDQPRDRIRPCARRGASLQGAHGLQPLQHGVHRRDRRDVGRRPLQILRIRARSGVHLDDGPQPVAGDVPRDRVRLDARRRLSHSTGARSKASGKIMQAPGQAPSDFIAMAGFGPTLANMGLTGFVGVIYVLAIGGDLNGPVIGAILTIVGFSAYGKHPRNIVPIMLGVFIGSLAKPWNAADPSAQLAALFGTTLAPIAGRFGWGWGLVAGFVHSSAAMSVGPLHAGLNLYNNGFAAGIVASVLVPVILAVRAGFGYDDGDLKA